MWLKLVICTFFVSYALCRTAKEFREFPQHARLSTAEYPSYNIVSPDGRGTYAFGFEIEDPYTGNIQFRDEEKLRNGTVRGAYGFMTQDGIVYITHYIADQYGYRVKHETKQQGTQIRPEVTIRPTLQLRPSNSINPDQLIQQQQNIAAFVSSTTPFPEPFETKQPIIDPQAANAIYQQHQININPTYNPLRDENVLNPYVSNAFLNQQVYPIQNANNLYGVRQGVDGTVSTTLSQNQLQSQNQPTRPNFPFFNWFTNNNNNNNNNDNNAQMDSNQQQQGPIISFISQIPNNIQNFAQNNPLTNFLNNFQPNQQQTVQNSNPFQNFISNAQNTIQQINPFQNIFSTPNKNPVTTQISNILPNLPQSDYIPQGSINNQIDTSVFSNDRFQSPAQFSSNSYNPYLNQQYQNTPQFGNLQSNLIANNPQQLSGFSQNNGQQQLLGYSQNNPSHQLSGYSQNVYPQQQWQSANNAQQYPQQLLQTQQYPLYQRPINPSTLVSNNVSKKKNRKKTKNGNKTSVEIPDSDSNWFQDFLDKRKEISIETNTKKSSNKSDDDDDSIEDYFLK